MCLLPKLRRWVSVQCKTFIQGKEGCVLTTTSTEPYFFIANSNSSTCSSNFVTSHLMHAPDLHGSKIESEIMESPSLPSSFLNLGYHFRGSCNVQVTDNEFRTGKKSDRKRKYGHRRETFTRRTRIAALSLCRYHWPHLCVVNVMMSVWRLNSRARI